MDAEFLTDYTKAITEAYERGYKRRRVDESAQTMVILKFDIAH